MFEQTFLLLFQPVLALYWLYLRRVERKAKRLKHFVLAALTIALYLFLIQVSGVSVWPNARLWWGGAGWGFVLRAGLGSTLLALGLAWGLRRAVATWLRPLFWLFLGNALFLACAMWGEWL